MDGSECVCHGDSHDNQRDGAVEEVRLLSLGIL